MFNDPSVVGHTIAEYDEKINRGRFPLGLRWWGPYLHARANKYYAE